jgi:hypothetical protein
VDPLQHKEVLNLRSELLQLAEALKDQIARIVDLRLAQFTGGVASRTRH